MVHMQSLHNSKAHSESTSLLGTQFLRVRYEYRPTQHASMVLPLIECVHCVDHVICHNT